MSAIRGAEDDETETRLSCSRIAARCCDGVSYTNLCHLRTVMVRTCSTAAWNVTRGPSRRHAFIVASTATAGGDERDLAGLLALRPRRPPLLRSPAAGTLDHIEDLPGRM